MADRNTTAEPDQEPGPGFFAIVLSTLAAAVGVQSGRNQARDFNRGKVGHYIAAGVIFTVIFVLSLVFVVKTILKNSGL